MSRRDPDPEGLDASRSRAVESLADSADVARAAETAGVDAETLRGWLARDPEFIAGLNRARAERGDRLRVGDDARTLACARWIESRLKEDSQ